MSIPQPAESSLVFAETLRPTWKKKALALVGRETTSGEFLPEVDGLRFVAISLVVLYHSAFHNSAQAPAAFVAVSTNGYFGVNLFFALSGFILGLPFARFWLTRAPPVSLKRYFLRRVRRLEPPYLINLAFFFALKILFTGRAALSLFPHFMASAVYLHGLIFGEPSTINYFAWSLEVEVQFYILAPLLTAAFFSIRSATLRRCTMAATLVAIGLARIMFPIPEASRLSSTIVNHIEWFLVGFLLVEVYVVSWSQKPRASERWDLLTIFAWPAMFFVLNAGRTKLLGSGTALAVTPWLVLLAYVAAFRGRWTRHLLTRRPIYIIGGMCYSTYLYHGLVVRQLDPLFARAWERINWYVVFLVGGTLCYVLVFSLGFVTFVLFEKPFMRTGRRPVSVS
jgi:peptidoglycan/LPS O-acetylase OafA/YrhL